jgi:phosphoribosylanthranilate isomerase
MLLLDSGLGGGRRFDWSLLQDIHRPYYLAGGLDSENVVDAVRTLRPYGVDVSSGVEQDGIKDGEKVRRFIRAVRENDGMRKTEKESGGEKA